MSWSFSATLRDQAIWVPVGEKAAVWSDCPAGVNVVGLVPSGETLTSCEFGPTSRSKTILDPSGSEIRAPLE